MISGVRTVLMLVRSAAGLVLSRARFVIRSDESRQRFDVTLEIDNLGIVGGVMEPGQINLLTETREYRFLMEKDGESGGEMRSFLGSPVRFYSHDQFAFRLPFSIAKSLSQESIQGILILSSGFRIFLCARFASRFADYLLEFLGKPVGSECDEVVEEVLREDAWHLRGLLGVDQSGMEKRAL